MLARAVVGRTPSTCVHGGPQLESIDRHVNDGDDDVAARGAPRRGHARESRSDTYVCIRRFVILAA